jgi:TIR domain/LCCL domain
LTAKTAFISYASDDDVVAHTISAYLEKNAVSCWIAPRDVRPGADYASEIIDGIETSAVFVLVLSEHANASEFVKREVERAVSKGKPIFPVRVREVTPSKSLELFISSAEWIDAWQPPIEQYLERLAESIRSAAALYPAGRGDSTQASQPAPERPGRRAGAMAATTVGRTPTAQRSLVVAVVALIAIVAVLGGLLAWNMFRKPSVPEPSTTSTAPAPPAASTNRPPGVEFPPATTPRSEAPASPEAPSAGPRATDPCPRTLSVNRELPTPFSCACSAQSTADAAIWGTDVYTDDSSLCRAALHAGVITSQGGPITVMRSEGRPLYVGSTRNGVRSNDYGAYQTSIAFKGTAAPPPGPGLCPATLSINKELPTPFTCRCSAQATHDGAVWGTDVYTDDSSLCRGALHAGIVTPAGGTITVTRSEGRALYVGTTRNGVVSNDYGAYPTSVNFR